MPKRTLTPIQQSRFFLVEHTSRVVVSYIPERRVEAEEQCQGTAAGAAAGFAVGQERQTRCTLYFLRVRSKSIRARGGTWNDKMNTGFDGILWASLRSNNQVQVLADRVGRDT